MEIIYTPRSSALIPELPKSYKWGNHPKDILPLWVADMDFRTPEAVIEALKTRADHGVFGYEFIKDELSESIVHWLAKQHAWNIEASDLLHFPGVVASLNLAVRSLIPKGSTVAVFTPVYPAFRALAHTTEIKLVEIPLRKKLSIDGKSFEYAFTEEEWDIAFANKPAALLLSNPHNPIGKALNPSAIKLLVEKMQSHDTLLISDDIWADLVLSGEPYRPLAKEETLKDRCVTLCAPSKTFNIPGLGYSFAVVHNPQLRARLAAAGRGILPDVNVLGTVAANAAYREGGAWLIALKQTLSSNLTHAVNILNTELGEYFPQMAKVPEATFLLWLDFSRELATNTTKLHGETSDASRVLSIKELNFQQNPAAWLLEHARVALNSGGDFGGHTGHFARLNVATSLENLNEALYRITNAIKKELS